jgi:hypothetical protein
MKKKQMHDGQNVAPNVLKSESRKILHHDLDHLAGTWKEDPEFDEALRLQRQIDPELWR